MSADLTCSTCNGDGSIRLRWGVAACDCHDGRRLPTLDEWDALKAELADAGADAQAWWDALQDERDWLCQQVPELEAERDRLEVERARYHRALDAIAFGLQDRPDLVARAALGSEPDLAERTRRIKADE